MGNKLKEILFKTETENRFLDHICSFREKRAKGTDVFTFSRGDGGIDDLMFDKVKDLPFWKRLSNIRIACINVLLLLVAYAIGRYAFQSNEFAIYFMLAVFSIPVAIVNQVDNHRELFLRRRKLAPEVIQTLILDRQSLADSISKNSGKLQKISFPKLDEIKERLAKDIEFKSIVKMLTDDELRTAWSQVTLKEVGSLNSEIKQGEAFIGCIDAEIAFLEGVEQS